MEINEEVIEIKEDCFACDKEHHKCNALNDLYCEKEKCRFYKNKNEINESEIERSIKAYTIGHMKN